jgi:signal transduction histidine kinase
VTLTVDLPTAVASLRGDHVRLVQVLANLVTNALDFTPAGGRIEVRGAEAGGRLQVSVEDTGSGIPEEDLPYVFERHWRGTQPSRRTAGSGLGLTIVRGIVQAHGGTTWVESVAGAGSTFHFTLPTALAPE